MFEDKEFYIKQNWSTRVNGPINSQTKRDSPQETNKNFGLFPLLKLFFFDMCAVIGFFSGPFFKVRTT